MQARKLTLMICTVLLVFPAAEVGATQLVRSVIAAGGTTCTNGTISLQATAGQPAIGIGDSAGLLLYTGFWSPLEGDGPVVPVVMPDIIENRLLPSSPNPFNPVTKIRYSVAVAGPVTVTVFNVRGERIRTLVDEYQEPGHHDVYWDGRDSGGGAAASGVYFCVLQAGDYQAANKMLLVK